MTYLEYNFLSLYNRALALEKKSTDLLIEFKRYILLPPVDPDRLSQG